MARTGRPTKRSDETRDAIVKALQNGYTRKAAAAAGGISYSTMREWELEFPDFSEALEKAEGRAQVRYIDKIAAAESWQAAAWILERRWPRDYGRRESVEMTGKDGGPIDHRNITELPDHERAALAEAIRSHLRSQDAGEAVATSAGDSEA